MKLKTLAPWKKLYDQPKQHIKKQRHYFANKDSYSQSYGFSSSHVWMWELDYKESWMLKNWCFWTVELKSLESPLDSQEIQPVHLKEISPEYSLEGLMLKLKLQYFGHLMRWTDSFEKTLLLGKIEGWRIVDDRGWDGWGQWTWVWVNSGSFWWTTRPGVHGVAKSWTWLSNWNIPNWAIIHCLKNLGFHLLQLVYESLKLISHTQFKA